MARWHLIFWEPTASPHKADLLRALAAAPQVASCTAVAQQEMSAGRAALGWALGAQDRARFIVSPSDEQVRAIVDSAPPDAVHILSGIRHVPCIEQALALVLAGKRRFGIMSEPRAFDGAAGLARLAHSLFTEGPLRRQSAFVLAIGRNGPPWFRMAGYGRDRIFPFGYFIAPSPALDGRDFDGTVRLGYLGRLTREKGIHLFLDAIGKLTVPASISIAGAGAEEALVHQAAARAPNPFHFAGAVPMAETARFLRDQDIVVVPSTTRDDGWGVVVSEALMAGAAVIATKQVGASVCLTPPGNGIAINPSSTAIADAVCALVVQNGLDARARASRRKWACDHLVGEAGARHLLGALDTAFHARPPQALFFTE